MSALADGWREVRRAAAWHRRLLAAGLVAVAVALAISELAPAPPPTVAVLAAARDLPAGARLAPADLVEVRLPPAAVPVGALRARADATGRTLAGPARRGETLTDSRLVGAALLAAHAPAGADLVAAPVRIADAGAVALLRPGDRVDVLAAATREDGPSAARVVAAAVPVLTVPRASDAAYAEGGLVVLATTSATAATLARAAVTSRLSVTLRSS